MATSIELRREIINTKFYELIKEIPYIQKCINNGKWLDDAQIQEIINNLLISDSNNKLVFFEIIKGLTDKRTYNEKEMKKTYEVFFNQQIGFALPEVSGSNENKLFSYTDISIKIAMFIASNKEKMCCPIHVDGNHWTALVAIKNSNNTVSFIYYDTRGTLTNNLKEHVRFIEKTFSKYFKNVSYTYNTEIEQRDEYTCGVWSILNLAWFAYANNEDITRFVLKNNHKPCSPIFELYPGELMKCYYEGRFYTKDKFIREFIDKIFEIIKKLLSNLYNSKNQPEKNVSKEEPQNIMQPKEPVNINALNIETRFASKRNRSYDMYI